MSEETTSLAESAIQLDALPPIEDKHYGSLEALEALVLFIWKDKKNATLEVLEELQKRLAAIKNVNRNAVIHSLYDLQSILVETTVGRAMIKENMEWWSQELKNFTKEDIKSQFEGEQKCVAFLVNNLPRVGLAPRRVADIFLYFFQSRIVSLPALLVFFKRIVFLVGENSGVLESFMKSKAGEVLKDTFSSYEKQSRTDPEFKSKRAKTEFGHPPVEAAGFMPSVFFHDMVPKIEHSSGWGEASAMNVLCSQFSCFDKLPKFFSHDGSPSIERDFYPVWNGNLTSPEEAENEVGSLRRKIICEQQRHYVVKNMERMMDLEYLRPGICVELYEKFGIRNFARHPIDVWVEQFDYRNTPGKFVVVWSSLVDHNGGLRDEEGMLYRALEKHFLFRICEGSTPEEDYLRMYDRYVKRFSGSTIVLGVVEDHSDGENLCGSGVGKADIQKWWYRHGQTISDLFEEGATLVLNSCSTGKESGLAQEISQHHPLICVGPAEPAGIASWKLGFSADSKPPSVEVEYLNKNGKSVSAGVYRQGVKK